jgi:hypothetical protein
MNLIMDPAPGLLHAETTPFVLLEQVLGVPAVVLGREFQFGSFNYTYVVNYEYITHHISSRI